MGSESVKKNHPKTNFQVLQTKKWMKLLKRLSRKLVGGWTNPIEKYAREIGKHFPRDQGENKKCLSCHHLVVAYMNQLLTLQMVDFPYPLKLLGPSKDFPGNPHDIARSGPSTFAASSYSEASLNLAMAAWKRGGHRLGVLPWWWIGGWVFVCSLEPPGIAIIIIVFFIIIIGHQDDLVTDAAYWFFRMASVKSSYLGMWNPSEDASTRLICLKRSQPLVNVGVSSLFYWYSIPRIQMTLVLIGIIGLP